MDAVDVHEWLTMDVHKWIYMVCSEERNILMSYIDCLMTVQ